MKFFKFDYSEEDAKRREEESKRMNEALQKENERLDEEESQIKQGLLDKIKPLKDRKDRKRLEYRQECLEKVRQNMEAQFVLERQRINKNRREIEKQQIKTCIKNQVRKHRLKIAITAALIISVISGVNIANNISDKRAEEALLSAYEQCVEYVENKEYSSAAALLSDVQMEDASYLLKYCNVMNALNGYEGTAEAFYEELYAISNGQDVFESETIKSQYNDCLNNTIKVIEVNDSLNEIDLSKISIEAKKDITNLREEYDALCGLAPELTCFLVSSEKLESAENTISNIEKKTPVGNTIIAICEIGTVSLNSDDEILVARELYDSLSQVEQDQVTNYELLTSAEKTYAQKVVAAEKAEKEAAERAEKAAEEKRIAEKKAAEEKAAKEKAEAERVAAEKQKAESVSSSSSSVVTGSQSASSSKSSVSGYVWLPETGSKYHSKKDCGRMNPNTATQVSLEDAINRGFERCGKCW